MSSEKSLIAAGTVVGHHGVRGEIKINSQASAVETAELARTIEAVTRLNIGGKWYDVVDLMGHKGVLRVRLNGINSREDAAPLIGKTVSLNGDELPKLPSGEFYAYELVGSDVVTEDGLELGKIVNIFSNGSSDVYEIKGARKEVLLPVIEGVTKKVDTVRKLVIVRVPEGLLDDDEAPSCCSESAGGGRKNSRGKSK